MKTSFPGYYRPDDSAFSRLWQSCTFVLDANILLNLYRYPSPARDQLLGALDRIEDRVWMPFHAALEYQRNRPAVIAEQKLRFRDVREIVSNSLSRLEAELANLRLKTRHSLIESDDLIYKLRPIFSEYDNYLTKLEKLQIDVQSEDIIRQQIDRIFEGRIGPSPDQLTVDAIVTEGEKRFKYQTPPGFRDDKKLSRFSYLGVNYEQRFGDLIVWKQILEHASRAEIKQLVFLTDDEKDDWWWSVNSSGQKKLGPSPELIAEMHLSGVQQFYMYGSNQFLTFARKYLNINVSEESIEQVRDVTNELKTERANVSIMEVELAVVEWARGAFQGCSLKLADTIDYIVLDKNDIPIAGIEILQESMTFSYQTIRDKIDLIYSKNLRLPEILIIMVTKSAFGEQLFTQIHGMLARQLPPAVKLTLGAMVMQDGTAKFVAVDRP